MSDFDKFEALDKSIQDFRLTVSEVAEYLDVPEEWIENAIENKDFKDIVELRGENLIHMDDIKDYVIGGGVKKIMKRMEELENE